jgi:hypothetical protein
VPVAIQGERCNLSQGKPTLRSLEDARVRLPREDFPFVEVGEYELD